MPRVMFNRKMVLVGVTGAALVAFAIAGCSSTSSKPSSASPTTRPTAASVGGKSSQPIGKAQLWSETCNRCHNAWSPDQLSPAQWAAVMQHMRFRANLTEQEYDDILQFLQAAH